ncbi:hypothetical protein ABW21_db0202529 [Orbilia brochopaga]|nr:hypothetical protein ABW21_db0202529 [Drechslerella brochopaga]
MSSVRFRLDWPQNPPLGTTAIALRFLNSASPGGFFQLTEMAAWPTYIIGTATVTGNSEVLAMLPGDTYEEKARFYFIGLLARVLPGKAPVNINLAYTG